MRNWWVAAGTEPARLCPEDEVVAMLKRRAPITAVAYEGSAEWIDPKRYAPFAEALMISIAAPSQTVRPDSATDHRAAMWGGIGMLLALGGIVVTAVVIPQKSAAPAEPTQAPPTQNASLSPEPPREFSALERAQQTDDWRSALIILRPMMGGSTTDFTKGTLWFAAWAAQNLRWSDVAVAQDETNYGRVQKDTATERGKRICVSGEVVEIYAVHSDIGTVFNGGMITPAMHVFRFLAVGSTGSLVQDSAARFCGVVTGWNDYTNSAGGSSHAVVLVGMFDLPENHTRAPRRRPGD